MLYFKLLLLYHIRKVLAGLKLTAIVIMRNGMECPWHGQAQLQIAESKQEET